MHKEEFHTLPQSVIEFLNYLSVVRSKSELTVLEYASDLRLFFRFMLVYRGIVAKDTEFEKIDISFIDLDFIKTVKISDAYAFLSYCRSERKNDSASIARKVSSLRAFFKYLCVKMKQIPENPMEELESPKLKKALPKYLSLEESIQLLESIDGRDKERDYAIITLFLNCGLRLSELCSLNYSDIKTDGTMTVTGKGNKERTIYLNEMCVNAVKEYMKVRPVDGVKDKHALFLSNRKSRISPKTVQHIVEKFIEKSGLGDRGYSTHKLRHTAATLMYQKGGVDVLLIKDILGHENLATTEIYTHIVDEQLKDAVSSNPLNKLKGKKTSE
ncbi:MAG: tyrosine recombinase XerC [Clostridiaceae bacterium]|nr:tyrosine recombinase XerC [Clostridiaceae bacterium]MDY5889616.1 tyrosine recombinase XerC [Oscillospiraceae bacterium]